MTVKRIRGVLLELVSILLFLLFLAPFFIVVVNSSKMNGDIIRDPISFPLDWSLLWKHIQAVIHNSNMNYWKSFLDSAVITVLSLTAIVLCSSMAAWVLVRNHKKWSTVIFMIFVAAMVIPFQVVMLPLLSWFRQVSNF